MTILAALPDMAFPFFVSRNIGFLDYMGEGKLFSVNFKWVAWARGIGYSLGMDINELKAGAAEGEISVERLLDVIVVPHQRIAVSTPSQPFQQAKLSEPY